MAWMSRTSFAAPDPSPASARSLPASSLLSVIEERLWPSRSCRSRANRSRSSETARRAISWRASCSSRTVTTSRLTTIMPTPFVKKGTRFTQLSATVPHPDRAP
nr:hypothetical protein [Rubrobacter tropicus]